MASKRYKNLENKISKPETIDILLPKVKKNCNVKFDESVDLSLQINNKQKKK